MTSGHHAFSTTLTDATGVTGGNAGNAPAQGADAIGNAIGDAASSLLNGLFK